jgi:hypothetical protein
MGIREHATNIKPGEQSEAGDISFEQRLNIANY